MGIQRHVDVSRARRGYGPLDSEQIVGNPKIGPLDWGIAPSAAQLLPVCRSASCGRIQGIRQNCTDLNSYRYSPISLPYAVKCYILFNMLNKVARFLPLLYLFSVLQVVLHAEDQFFSSAGVRIHNTIDGKGEPVILIHGYALSITTNWGKPGIIKGLSDNYEVIATDSEKEL